MCLYDRTKVRYIYVPYNPFPLPPKKDLFIFITINFKSSLQIYQIIKYLFNN